MHEGKVLLLSNTATTTPLQPGATEVAIRLALVVDYTRRLVNCIISGRHTCLLTYTHRDHDNSHLVRLIVRLLITASSDPGLH